MDLERIESILRLLQRQAHVEEVHVEGHDWRLHARKAPGVPVPPPDESTAPEEPQRISVRSDRVGFYRAPAVALRTGEYVDRAAPIGSIDSMGIINPISAELGGYLVESLVTDGDPVEYGQELFILSPEPSS